MASFNAPQHRGLDAEDPSRCGQQLEEAEAAADRRESMMKDGVRSGNSKLFAAICAGPARTIPLLGLMSNRL